MNLEIVGNIVKQLAPLLGGAIIGPAGAALGTLVAAKFGGDVNKPQELAELIQTDPNAKIKLLEIQSTNEIQLQRIYMQMAENDLKYHFYEKEIEYKNRNSAYQRETELARTGKRDLTPAMLAYTLTIGVFTALYYLFSHHIPAENKELIVGIISALTTVWVGAMAYYHGSSAGSRNKDALLLNNEIKTLPQLSHTS